MYKSFLSLCFAVLACARPRYSNDDFDELDTSSDGIIGVYKGLDYRQMRLGRSNVSDSPLQGLRLHSAPNAAYFDGDEANIYAAFGGETFHLRRLSAGCVAAGRATPCDVRIWGYDRDQRKPPLFQRVVRFRPEIALRTASILRKKLTPWRFNGMKSVKIETVYKDVSPEEGRTIIDDVVYCWDFLSAYCWPMKGEDRMERLESD